WSSDRPGSGGDYTASARAPPEWLAPGLRDRPFPELPYPQVTRLTDAEPGTAIPGRCGAEHRCGRHSKAWSTSEGRAAPGIPASISKGSSSGGPPKPETLSNSLYPVNPVSPITCGLSRESGHPPGP